MAFHYQRICDGLPRCPGFTEALVLNFPLQDVAGLSANAGLWVAFILGSAFGFFLEQGGMGDARKIAAQFYFRDLAVLKIMFSAIVTTALGLFWFARVGWLDYDLIFLPPTYVWPQVVGGFIFGAGFVIGGLCPGTSCVALSSGRLDGLVLLLGLFFGIFLFNELHGHFDAFYRSGSLGSVALPDTLGVSNASMLVILVALAIAAFVVAEALERRNSGP